MTDQEQRWDLVGLCITQRMDESAITQAELVRASGVSAPTVRRLMRGEPGSYKRSTVAKVLRAVGIPPRALDDILEGKHPGLYIALAEIDEQMTPEGTQKRVDVIEDLRAEVARLRALVVELGGTPEDEPQ